MPLETISQRIFTYIKNKGITQTFVSKKTGIHHSSLNAKLHGNINFSPDEIELVCWALGCQPNEFIRPHPPKGNDKNENVS